LVEWRCDAEPVPLEWDLLFSLDHFTIDKTTALSRRWYLTALDVGDLPLTLRETQTGLEFERMLRVRASKQEEIRDIEQTIVAPLAARIQIILTQLREDEFNSDSVSQIPFHLVTPEDYIEMIYPSESTRTLRNGLYTIRTEQQRNRPLLDHLIELIAPTYSPVAGCCIPYDPELATQLAEIYPLYRDSLAVNLLASKQTDALWFEQNIAAFLLHEKFGHGLFYNKTTLGNQLTILWVHGLLYKEDRQRLPAPYPRILGTEYASAIEALNDSSIIVNEGFAAWLELTYISKLAPVIGQAVYRRKGFLIDQDEALKSLMETSEYFQRFPPFMPPSRYREGYEYFRLIHSYFGDLYGPKCAVQAMIKATDINVGITEDKGTVRFALSPISLRNALFEMHADDARADMRLRRIHKVLSENQKEVWKRQRELQCHLVCLHRDCPVNEVIQNQLTW
jgi:hypothetical protein